MVQNFGLAIHLRVIGRGMFQVSATEGEHCFLKKLRKIGSLYEIMEMGNLWCFTTISRNNWAIVGAMNCVGKPPKWAHLLKWSTMTRMVVWHIEFGNPMIKSIVNSSQMWLGMDNVCKSPAGGIVEYFTRWQTSHVSISSCTSERMWG